MSKRCVKCGRASEFNHAGSPLFINQAEEILCHYCWADDTLGFAYCHSSRSSKEYRKAKRKLLQSMIKKYGFPREGIFESYILTNPETGRIKELPTKKSNYIWRRPNGDFPIHVTNSLGKGSDDREYVKVAGSHTGIPLDGCTKIKSYDWYLDIYARRIAKMEEETLYQQWLKKRPLQPPHKPINPKKDGTGMARYEAALEKYNRKMQERFPQVKRKPTKTGEKA